LAQILKKLFGLLLLATVAYGEQIAVSQFSYLNNNESSVIIEPSQAQEILNVDVTPDGKSIKKRKGYGLYKTLGSGQAIHGGHKFFDSTGNDVQVWGSSTSLFGIVGDGNITQLVSSATLSATWDCTDTQGFAYCGNTSRDYLVKTNGATADLYRTQMVQGSIVEVTTDRLLIAGTTNVNTLYVSKAVDFTNFAIGTGANDSYFVNIAAPGSKITNLRYGCGRILWWKDQSFGYLAGNNQTDIENVIVSDTIGTNDNSSAIDPGGNVYFRGQDGHKYVYDCSELTKLSVDISSSIASSGRRTSNAWTITSQSDFETGVSSQPGHVNMTSVPGSVVVSSFNALDTTDANFTAGTVGNTVVRNNSVAISTSATNIDNPSFETGTAGTSITNWNLEVPGWSYTGTFNPGTDCGAVSADAGTRAIHANGSTISATYAQLIDVDASSTVLVSQQITEASACSWVTESISSDTYARKRVKLRFKLSSGTGDFYVTSDPFLFTGVISYRKVYIPNGSSTHNMAVDNITNGKMSLSAAVFHSSVIDTGKTWSVGKATAGWTVDGFVPAFALQTSIANTGPWTIVATSTNTETNLSRYVRYAASFTVSGTGNAATTFNDLWLLTVSSGTYLSDVKNAPNISAWDAFMATYADGGGSHSFFIRSSTNTFTKLSSTPSWTAITAGAVVSISTGAYFQVRDDFYVDVTTDNPTLNDFTINWYEGSASDKAYISYFKDSVWYGIAYGAGNATNNAIFRYDLLQPGWTIYNIGTGGMLVQGNSLYFGSTSADGRIYKFGDSDSDNGTPITAYWKSKDYAGSDIFSENEYVQLDIVATRDQNETLSVSYAVDASTSPTSYNVSLSSTTQPIIRSKKLLPAGKIGAFFNVKLGDTSSTSSWEVLGFRFIFNPLGYRPSR
jgi:hypothetical protein